MCYNSTMVTIKVPLGNEASLSVELDDHKALQAMIRERGTLAFFEEVRAAMEMIAAPPKTDAEERSLEARAYFAMHLIDELIDNL